MWVGGAEGGGGYSPHLLNVDAALEHVLAGLVGPNALGVPNRNTRSSTRWLGCSSLGGLVHRAAWPRNHDVSPMLQHVSDDPLRNHFSWIHGAETRLLDPFRPKPELPSLTPYIR